MTTDEQGYLRGILEHPADDFRRLIYADWLEENGQADRCEFIRLQLELAKYAPERSGGLTEWTSDDAMFDAMRREENPRQEHLKRRECESLTANEITWIADTFDRRIIHETPDNRQTLLRWHWSRGFVSSIELSTAAFLEHAASIFAAAPVTSVRLTDLDPTLPLGFAWFEITDRQFGRDYLPGMLFDRLSRGRIHADDDDRTVYREYDAAKDAWDDLSEACIDHGRSLANLPALDAVSEPAGVWQRDRAGLQAGWREALGAWTLEAHGRDRGQRAVRRE